MATTHPNTATRNYWADRIPGLLNGGTIKVYDSSDVLLVSWIFLSPAFPAASGGTTTANAGSDAIAVASGVASYYQWVTSSSVVEEEGTCGRAGTNSDMTLDEVDIIINQTYKFPTVVHTAPD